MNNSDHREPCGKVNFRMNGGFYRQMARPPLGYLLLFTLIILQQPLDARTGSSFPSEMNVGDHQLELRGKGTFNWLFLTLYEGALYLRPDAPHSAVLQAEPKHLEFLYQRAIPASRIVEAGEQILKRNTTPAEREAIAKELEIINQAYNNVRRGDRYALTFKPGHGTTLSRNGSAVLTIPGDQFAEIYFRIWFGENPANADFRDTLLGGTPTSEELSTVAR